MLSRIINTPNDYTLLILRLALGITFFAHGVQKVFGWYGGRGYSETMQMFTQMGVPGLLAFLAIAAEFLGGLGLIVGFLGRVAAFGIMMNMTVAILMVHLPFGFFMNWTGNKPGEGFEYHILALAIGSAVLIRGSGTASIDRMLSTGETQPDVLEMRRAA